MIGDGSHRVPKERTCLVANLGITGVEDADGFMSAARRLRFAGELPDLLLFLSHPGTVAVGLRDRRTEQPKDLLVPVRRLEEEGIALARSVRGGGITYHWPGQVVCYPILLLGPGERNIPLYMHGLEEIGIRTLRSFGVKAARSRESAAHVGLWHDRCKVASMGVRVSRWVTSFGFAINHEGDHEPSAYVRPCGLEGVRLTTMEEILGHAPPRDRVVDAIIENFAEVLRRRVDGMPADTLREIESLAGTTDPTG
jgi:lipoate-protein ligase B